MTPPAVGGCACAAGGGGAGRCVPAGVASAPACAAPAASAGCYTARCQTPATPGSPADWSSSTPGLEILELSSVLSQYPGKALTRAFSLMKAPTY